jgi:gliding motility-associated-like protein
MIQDTKGCLNNLLVNLVQPTAIDATITAISTIQCNNATALGSVTVNATGGTGALFYALDGNVSSQATGTFNNLTVGNHTVTVSDISGCTRMVSFQITRPSALSVTTISQANVTCNGSNNGSIAILGNGGTPNYSYQLDNSISQTSNTFTGIAPGSHTVTLSDANGCSSSLPFAITQPTIALTATAATPIAVRCNGGADGSLLINATGGTSPYTYNSNGSAFQPNNVFSNLHAGTYTLTVRDANGCSFALTSTVNEPALVEQGTVTVSNVKCYNSADGGFTINANGGFAPYRYSVQGSSFATNNIFTGLAAGTYDVIIKDFNLCTALAIVNIAQPPVLNAALSSVGNISCIGSFGSLYVTATGGTPVYQFSIDSGVYQNQNNFSNLTAGTHTVTVRDANTCTSTITANIIVANQLVVNAYADKTEICSNECANLLASGNNGTGNYVYDWTGVGVGAVRQVCPTTTTTYICVITDASGCTNTTSVTVAVNTAPQPVIIGAQAICTGSNALLTATGGSFTSYRWSNGQSTSFVYTNLIGLYAVTVTDAKGCRGSSSIAIAAYPLPLANAGSDISVYPNESFQLNASGAGANGTYLWTSGNNLSSTTIPNPTGVNLTETRSYTVIVTDEHGCTAADVVRVILEDQLSCLKTDEGITPNGDGMNETWVIDCLKYFPANQVEIYNRWGQQVFVEKNYRNLYEGKLENGTALPDGTYYYIVKVFNTDTPKTLYKGTLTILR